MTDDLITVSAGAQIDIEPGAYEVTLTAISEPRLIYPQTGPNAGREVALRDWTFALDNGLEVRAGASTASGPKSKTYAWLTALLGGRPPAVGSSYPRDQLIGRMAVATISIDDGGWPRITTLSAKPKDKTARPVETPAQAALKPAADDDLPF